MAFSNIVSLVSGIFQRIVTYPVDYYWTCPMDDQWHFPMEFSCCDVWCVIFCPGKSAAERVRACAWARACLSGLRASPRGVSPSEVRRAMRPRARGALPGPPKATPSRMGERERERDSHLWRLCRSLLAGRPGRCPPRELATGAMGCSSSSSASEPNIILVIPSNNMVLFVITISCMCIIINMIIHSCVFIIVIVSIIVMKYR